MSLQDGIAHMTWRTGFWNNSQPYVLLSFAKNFKKQRKKSLHWMRQTSHVQRRYSKHWSLWKTPHCWCQESMPTLSIIAPLHAKLVMGTEQSPDNSDTAKDIKAAIGPKRGRPCAWRWLLTVSSRIYLFSLKQTADIYSRLTNAVVAMIQK